MSLINNFCSNCGSPLKEGVKFCTNCGSKISYDKPDAVKDEEPEKVAEISETVEASEETNSAEVVQAAAGAEEITEAVENVETTKENAADAYYFEDTRYSQADVEPKCENEKPREKKHTGLKVLGCIIANLCVVLLSVLVTIIVLSWGGFIKTNDDSQKQEIKDPQTSTTVGGKEIKYGDYVTINIEGDAGNTATAVYAKCEQSVVGIRVVREMSATPWSSSTIQTICEGSGVIYSADGQIITNHHVISETIDENGNMKPGYTVQVFLDKSLQSHCEAKVIGSDSTTDLALIKIDVTGLIPAEFADIDKIQVGDTVYTIGSSGGLEFMNSICDGIISGINRNLSIDTGYAYDLIQTTAAINPGNSGGALLNNRGELVGICAMKIASSSVDDMCFAISGNTVKTIVDDISKNGKVVRPQMGVLINTAYDAQAAESSGLPAGAWIESVTAKGPADKAGLKASTIITAIDGVKITDFTSLRVELLKHKVGDTIVVTVYEYSKKSSKDLGEYKDYNVVLEAQE